MGGVKPCVLARPRPRLSDSVGRAPVGARLSRCTKSKPGGIGNSGWDVAPACANSATTEVGEGAAPTLSALSGMGCRLVAGALAAASVVLGPRSCACCGIRVARGRGSLTADTSSSSSFLMVECQRTRFATGEGEKVAQTPGTLRYESCTSTARSVLDRLAR